MSVHDMLLRVGDADLEARRFAPRQRRAGAPTIVFLHEALGSVSVWRDFPRKVAGATGCDVVAYSRQGFGQSSPRLEPYDTRFLHHESLVVLPAVLDALGVERPMLFGHSDGGSMALIAAGAGRTSYSGIVVLAPHLFVEPESLAGIHAAIDLWATTDFSTRLARHHRDAAMVFRRWHEVWLDPSHRTWNIEAFVRQISCPVLAIQGTEDEYATMTQLDAIARLAPDVELLKLEHCGHSPHRDQPDAVISATMRFVERVGERRG
jgi:pimeloyl-ACP methyl ester carboxylesterase